jgi:hypothetical protein
MHLYVKDKFYLYYLTWIMQFKEHDSNEHFFNVNRDEHGFFWKKITYAN